MKNGQLLRYGERFSRIMQATKLKNLTQVRFLETATGLDFLFPAFETKTAFVQNRRKSSEFLVRQWLSPEILERSVSFLVIESGEVLSVSGR